VTPEQQQVAGSLMRDAQEGDQSAYASLLVMLTPIARRFARARLGDVGWIDDVVQETLITVDRARHTYDPNRPFAPWFYTIASSRLVDALRREKRIAGHELAGDAIPDRPGGSGPRDEVDVEAVHAALRSLPPRQQEIIRSLKIEDQSVRQVAGRLGMTESAVKVTAHRGYRVLRRLLGDRSRED
jgi:RNA polymerase sigma-70 factor (ECF subfamily)